MALKTKTLKVPIEWHDLLKREEETSGVNCDYNGEATQYTVGTGITVYLLQSMIEKGLYVPEYRTSTLQICKFMKLVNYHAFRDGCSRWAIEQAAKRA